MAFHNIPPNGFPDIPDMEELEAVVKDVASVKTSVSGLATDVSNLSDNKANQITIAPFFDPEASYEVGDLVYYNGLSYRCTNDHEGEWDADDFAATTVAGELATLKSGLTNISSIISLHDIGNDYGFSDLVAEQNVTFFTNWTDNTNFPDVYGSGMMLPTRDDGLKVIIYILAGDSSCRTYLNTSIHGVLGTWKQLQFTT